MEIAIINGPNLNLLGKREPGIYGTLSFEDYFDFLEKKYSLIKLHYFQHNVEGELVSAIQKFGFQDGITGIILNAAAYSHTSLALADAIAAIPVPVIAVHISNIFAREIERKTDLLVGKSKGLISGLGLKGYELALRAFMEE